MRHKLGPQASNRTRSLSARFKVWPVSQCAFGHLCGISEWQRTFLRERQAAIGLERWAWAVRWPVLGREASRAELGEAFRCLEACVKFPVRVFSWQGPDPSGPKAVYQNSEQKPS